MRPRRSVPHTFEENLAAEKAKLEAQVAKLKPGPQKDALLKKIRQLDSAAHISEWLSSPGLQSQRPVYLTRGHEPQDRGVLRKGRGDP
jgi:hypothetical protein